METKAVGQQHGAAVRRAAAFTAALVVAVGRDVVLNVRRGAGYGRGFVQGLLRGDNAVPNA